MIRARQKAEYNDWPAMGGRWPTGLAGSTRPRIVVGRPRNVFGGAEQQEKSANKRQGTTRQGRRPMDRRRRLIRPEDRAARRCCRSAPRDKRASSRTRIAFRPALVDDDKSQLVSGLFSPSPSPSSSCFSFVGGFLFVSFLFPFLSRSLGSCSAAFTVSRQDLLVLT